MAEKWADWAERAIAEDRWEEAEAALERAQDFADVSSDLSYLLALVRRHGNRPQPAVLEAIRRAIETDRWKNHRPAEARLVEAAALIRVRFFDEALASLSLVTENALAAGASCLRLEALLGTGYIGEFLAGMEKALDRFPDDGRPVRLLFKYAADRLPREPFPAQAGSASVNDRALIDTVLARLDRYLETDPDLAFRAAPFIRDTEEARRLVSAYRAQGGDDPDALSVALNLGVIDERQAVAELFRFDALDGPAPPDARAVPTLDKDLLQKIWSLLRNNEEREFFRRNLFRFSGVISEDSDHDGTPETFARYESGQLREYRYDADQDGLFEWHIRMDAAEPSDGIASVSLDSLGRADIQIFWDRYPYVQRAVLNGVTYVYRSRNFPLSPVRFTPLFGDGSPQGDSAFLYPVRDLSDSRLTRRTLVSFAGIVERPSREFPGAVERIELERGIPVSGAEYLRGRTVSITEYRMGLPVLRRLDLDLDGRMETLRRFRMSRAEGDSGDEVYPLDYEAVLDTSESDWDGDGIYETGEEYLGDGRTVRSWDMNKDGIREYTEINGAEQR
jgi:tetratricopeptide (TPR) repeat protein